jgi:hypothetical protein
MYVITTLNDIKPKIEGSEILNGINYIVKSEL